MEINRAWELRREMTNEERMLWRRLRKMQLDFNFRRQAPLGHYIVDFVCHQKKVIIELDGGQHAEEKKIIYDEKRTAWLEGRGYKVLRYWNFQVSEEIEAVLEDIYSILQERSKNIKAKDKSKSTPPS